MKKELKEFKLSLAEYLRNQQNQREHLENNQIKKEEKEKNPIPFKTPFQLNKEKRYREAYVMSNNVEV
jgi:hypothetical protein